MTSTILILFVVTALVFFALDAVMLALVMKPLFAAHIGEAMVRPIRVVPAVVFYLAYVAGVIFLVSYPAFKSGQSVWLNAAVLGAMAYGTYEFTSYAIMKSWSPVMVATDVLWGTVLTAISATAGLAVARAFA